MNSLAQTALGVLPLRARKPGIRENGVDIGLSPTSLEIGTKRLRIGETCAATFAVTGYPAEVAAGWLEPLLAFPARIDVSVHIDPVPAPVAADRLRKQRARLESGRRASAEKGRLDDPETEAAAEDARELAYRVACGEGKLFAVGIYLSVYADTDQELTDTCAAVKSVADGMLLRLVPATFRTVQGWCSTLPLGLDVLKLRRTFDTDALATVFPFTSADLPLSHSGVSAGSAPGPVLYGVNASGSGLVVWDRWACDNHNSVVLARSGAGKSYFTKLDILRSLYQGVQVLVVDPEQEYTRLAEAVGGTVVELGAPAVRVNPLDLPKSASGSSDAVRRRALFVHSVVSVLLGAELTGGQRASLDAAILAAYAQAGITDDPRTHVRRAPTLKDVVELLANTENAEATSLAERLTPHTTGSFSGLFDGPTTTATEGHLVVFALRQLPDELKAIGTLLTLDAIWRQVSDPDRRQRRLVVVDEAWLLMKEPAGARFLFRMAKAARKQWAGLAVITQDAADLLGTDLGRAVVANAATQILLRQAPQAIDQVADAFRLSAGERTYLLTATRGQGLIVAGTARAALTAISSDQEHVLATSDPAELEALSSPNPNAHDEEESPW
ncbi:ATP-binding protein [Catenulispora sp. NL8]|uniref:ATP-binding protein n=1 Tax=Catenulispora pinistramenti TaxID=2705254 RepID=A0ABS5KH19_9ACTN|nr:ATP-binding protein [Catenulispora pinistramenti]MBS2545398.1 ATP-binding protein [Catenulispora pinistramenti]